MSNYHDDPGWDKKCRALAKQSLELLRTPMTIEQRIATLKKENDRLLLENDKLKHTLLDLWRASHAAYRMDQDPYTPMPAAADWKQANLDAAKLLKHHGLLNQ